MNQSWLISHRIKVITLWTLALCIVLVATEIGVREGGLVDVPLYNVDGKIGYIPKPSQSGRFLDKNRWVFNDRSMGVDANWDPTKHPNILLIGNSVVVGGNPNDQSTKLTTLIQHEVGPSYSVWPIAAGGWTNINEMAYLDANPDVAAAADFYVWEYMVGGLSKPATWSGDHVFPHSRPRYATYYFAKRELLPKLAPHDMAGLPPVGLATAENLRRFQSEISRLSLTTKRTVPGVLFLYPKKEEYLLAKRGVEWLPERPQLESICRQNGVVLIDVSRSPDWNETLYRDGVHPTIQGNHQLAKIITEAIKQDMKTD